MISNLVATAILLTTTATSPTLTDAPPTTRRVDAVDRDFGLEIADPYRWMEGDSNAEFDAWLRARGAEGRARFDAAPSLAAWRQRLAAIAGGNTRHSSVRQVGSRLFFLRQEAGREDKLMVRTADGTERIVYDPGSEPGATMSRYSVSPDGRSVAITVGRGGSEVGQIELRDVDSGKLRPDVLTPVWSEFSADWLPDGSGFAYTRVTHAVAGDPLQGMASYLHHLGDPQASDRLLVQADGAAPLVITPESFPIVQFDPSSDWSLLIVAGARPSARMCVAPRKAVVSGSATWRCLADFDDDVQEFALIGDRLYLRVGGSTPNFRIDVHDLRRSFAGRGGAQPVLTERPDHVLNGLTAARDALYVSSLRDGLGEIERVDYRSRRAQAIALPYRGRAGVTGGSRESGAIVSLTSWVEPFAFHRFDPKTGTLIDLTLAETSPGDYGMVAADEISATSADGTVVPLSVIRRRDQVLDGRAISYLSGYAGYGISLRPVFDPIYLEWVKSGEVVAICHARGGGEKGNAWHLAGSGHHKQRGVEDFVACARELAKRGYSTPVRVVGVGASAGGLLVGGAYAASPADFGAMVLKACILNPTRLAAARNGANQYAEFGDPRTGDGLQQLLDMDPYQHVHGGVTYPPLVLDVGLVDLRVAPWMSGKFAARVMESSPSTPVWVRTDTDVGHFATNISDEASEDADVFAAIETLVPHAENSANENSRE